MNSLDPREISKLFSFHHYRLVDTTHYTQTFTYATLYNNFIISCYSNIDSLVVAVLVLEVAVSVLEHYTQTFTSSTLYNNFIISCYSNIDRLVVAVRVLEIAVLVLEVAV